MDSKMRCGLLLQEYSVPFMDLETNSFLVAEKQKH